MVVELKEVENKGFKPFKVELTIETLEELKDLNARMQIEKEYISDAFMFKSELRNEEYILSNIIYEKYTEKK